MSELSQVLGSSGAKFEILHKGKTYKAKMIDKFVMDAFSKKLLSQAVDVALQMKRAMTPKQYEDHLNRINDDFMEGSYDMLSERGRRILQTNSGAVTICCIIFDLEEMEMVRLMAERNQEVISLLSLIIKESLPTMDKRVSDKDAPNSESVLPDISVPQSPV